MAPSADQMTTAERKLAFTHLMLKALVRLHLSAYVGGNP